MPKIFRSQMVLKPGLSHIDKTGNWALVDSPLNMQFFIEDELRYKLQNPMRETKDNELPPPLTYKIFADNSRNTLTVFYDSFDADEGTVKLRFLLNALEEKYREKLIPY